jgi:hypothetical protein
MAVAKADHLSRERHPVLDDPANWGTPGIWNPPTFNVKKFQKRLDRICGTSDGKPIVRLVWAWDKRCREFRYTKWDEFGRGVEGDHYYKYRAAVIPINDVDTVDICPPRWILEQRYEPGQYAASWEQSRWAEQCVGQDANGQPINSRIELRDAAPPEWYGFLMTIAEHEPGNACCARQWKERKASCWGYYREPSDRDLDTLQRAVSLRDADPYRYSPHEPLPPEAVSEITRAAFIEEEADKQAKQQQTHDIWSDFVKTHGWRIFEDRNSKALRHGKYHFLNNGKSKFSVTPSGLLVPSE